jgi:protein arginine kinase activator
MLCEECGQREAEYHTRTNINGKVSETHLCSACHKAHLSGQVFKYSAIGDLFNALTGGAEPTERKQQHMCARCGTTYDDFLKNGGYLGCENCYKEFGALLKPVILKTQGALRHTGKMPNPSPEDKLAVRYRALAAELQKAVAEERYEDCQKIQQEMRAIQKKNAQ